MQESINYIFSFLFFQNSQNNSIETVSQTESDTQTEEETGYSFDAGDLYDMRLDAQTIEDYYMKSCGDQFNLYTIDENGVLWGSGHNEYAQIGLGYADEEFHEEKVKSQNTLCMWTIPRKILLSI